MITLVVSNCKVCRLHVYTLCSSRNSWRELLLELAGIINGPLARIRRLARHDTPSPRKHYLSMKSTQKAVCEEIIYHKVRGRLVKSWNTHSVPINNGENALKCGMLF